MSLFKIGDRVRVSGVGLNVDAVVVEDRKAIYDVLGVFVGHGYVVHVASTSCNLDAVESSLTPVTE